MFIHDLTAVQASRGHDISLSLIYSCCCCTLYSLQPRHDANSSLLLGLCYSGPANCPRVTPSCRHTVAISGFYPSKSKSEIGLKFSPYLFFCFLLFYPDIPSLSFSPTPFLCYVFSFSFFQLFFAFHFHPFLFGGLTSLVQLLGAL